ncbi:nuclear transport factor 2 family protein [Streptomyces fradiae]|uniref:nuclear transport factor 2 family protein n=1 Tax=Streptomyces fradiae TaxID=1906 RepID=UPI0036F51BF5
MVLERFRVVGEPDPVAAAVAGELRLLEPAVRASRAEAERLLDPEFTEVGASGRRWTRDAVLAALPGDAAAPGAPPCRASGMAGVLLAPGLVHLTFETVAGGRRARRSSLWRRSPDGTGAPWRLYHHQGTPVPDGTP